MSELYSGFVTHLMNFICLILKHLSAYEHETIPHMCVIVLTRVVTFTWQYFLENVNKIKLCRTLSITLDNPFVNLTHNCMLTAV